MFVCLFLTIPQTLSLQLSLSISLHSLSVTNNPSCTCRHLFPFLQQAVFLSLPPLLSMLQAFTIPSPATPKEHPRLPLVRYPSTQRCSSDRDSNRRTSRWTSGAQADRRAVHKQADERRISDASAMHQRWTSDAGATSRADGRMMHEGQRNRQTNRQTRDGPAMDQRCTSDRATPRPTMDEQATDHDSSRPVRDEQWTTGR